VCPANIPDTTWFGRKERHPRPCNWFFPCACEQSCLDAEIQLAFAHVYRNMDIAPLTVIPYKPKLKKSSHRNARSLSYKPVVLQPSSLNASQRLIRVTHGPKRYLKVAGWRRMPRIARPQLEMLQALAMAQRAPEVCLYISSSLIILVS
jgi:hypothetical protein